MICAGMMFAVCIEPGTICMYIYIYTFIDIDIDNCIKLYL